ncbi:transmembrane protein 154 isoform X1 [Cavia porcellus]|uniref:transmembrane protein 154 isoform X1 n=1 Tax=Cavia porcellus TaxID=10141 RepID=UPI0006619C6E|nr:transmembrane protein 154 isoform X1 [Cavia porcellus]
MSAPHAAACLGVLGLALGLAAHQGNCKDVEYSGNGLQEDNKTNEETTLNTFLAVTPEAITADTNSTHLGEDSDQLEFVLMVLIPLILLALLFVCVALLATYYKRKRTKQEPSSQGSQSALQTCELGGENLKVPIFEEDTPSVMEIEMEELDKWMNSMNRSADCECLPTVKEEKEPNHNPSDSES